MKKIKQIMVGILSVCTLFLCTACGKVGGFVIDEYINGERVSSEQAWKNACKRTSDEMKRHAFEVQSEGVFKVSLFKAKGMFKVQGNSSKDGITTMDVDIEESFPLKAKNKNNALVMYEDGREMLMVVEEEGKRVSYEVEKYMEEFLYGEYGTCYATYMVTNLLMFEVVENIFDYFTYDALSKAYVLDADSIPRDQWGELNNYDIDLQMLDFKVWICNGRIEKMVFDVEAKSNQFLKGVMVEGAAVGQFRWLDEE